MVGIVEVKRSFEGLCGKVEVSVRGWECVGM